MTYRVVVTSAALQALEAIPDRRVREQIAKRIQDLTHDPEQQGKPLRGEFIGCRSLRAVGQRYRIIYRVERAKVLVIILALGLRKEGDRRDVYQLAQKLIRLGLIQK